MDILIIDLFILSSLVLSDSLTSRTLYNVALNKPTNQSSTYKHIDGYEGSSSHAVDGILDPIWTHRSCASTNGSDENWWQVDLGRRYNITQVTIQNRQKYHDLLFNFTIQVAEDVNKPSTRLIGAQLCYFYHLGDIGAGELKTLQCPDNAVGRYVRITKNSNVFLNWNHRFLTLCEVIVEVRADQCTNLDLAVHKTATQSSTYISNTNFGHAWRSVDGNLAPNMPEGQSCSHTGGTGYQWWQVDLGKLYHIQQVSIQNRDIFDYRLKNFIIEVSETNQFDMPNHIRDARLCYNYTEPSVPSGVLRHLPCPNNIIGRYIRISKIVQTTDDALCLCEVVVEGGDPSCIDVTTTEAQSTITELETTTSGLQPITTVLEAETSETQNTTTEHQTTEVQPTTTEHQTTEVQPTTTEHQTTEVQPTTTEPQTTEVQSTTTEPQTQVTTVGTDGTSSQASNLSPKQCFCRCKNITALQKYYNRTKESLIEELKEELMVNKKKTSSYTRKLVSADDGRTSSRNIGYVGAIILVAVGLTIIVPDMIRLATYTKNK